VLLNPGLKRVLDELKLRCKSSNTLFSNASSPDGDAPVHHHQAEQKGTIYFFSYFLFRAIRLMFI